MRREDMRKGDLTRQKIIELSAPVFNQKGFAGAALSDLMAATGLEKGGIYRHFESKQKLAEDAFDYAWERAMDKRFEGAAAIPDAVDCLIHVIRNFQDRRAGLVPGGCPLMNTATEADDSNPRLRVRASRALARLIRRVRSIVQEGQRKGQVRDGVDDAELAVLMIETLEGAIMIGRLQRSDAPIALACNHLIEHLEASVRSVDRQAIAPASSPTRLIRAAKRQRG